VAFDGVPWAVEDGAPTPAVLRSLAWAAGAGAEGIISGPDLRVTALGMPGGAVQAAPGVAVVPAAGPSFSGQSYVVRAPTSTQVPVGATAAGGGRSDLVVARVENPQADPSWPIPTDVTVGPYVFLRVIQDVPPGTTRVQDVRPGDSAVTLARIDIPAATSVITQAMITDLRKLAQPRSARVARILSGAWSTPDTIGALTAAWEDFPLGARWNIQIPTWATHAVLEASWSQILAPDGEARGQLRARLGNLNGVSTAYRTLAAARGTYVHAAEVTIPAALRGTVQPLFLEGLGTAGFTGVLTADIGSTATSTVTFLQAASVD